MAGLWISGVVLARPIREFYALWDVRMGDKMAEDWLMGRKEISNYMHVCWDTVKKWRREYDCPVYTSPGGRPTALARELDQWLIAGSREREGEKGRGEGLSVAAPEDEQALMKRERAIG